MTAVERTTTFDPGYDRMTEGYDRHGMHITWRMTAPEGVVQFVMDTGWVPGPAGPLLPGSAALFPMVWDLSYHWPTPHYAGQPLRDCDFLPGGACYYDGSGIDDAQPVMAAFIADGEDAVWDALDDYYRLLTAQSGDWLADAVEAVS